jgi:hypothetical protein
MGLTDLPTGALPMSGVQLEEWRVELDRFLGELSEQSSAALEALARCRSAAEVLEVEYAWLGARSKIYANAGERFAQVCAEIAQGLSRMEQGQTPF